MHRVLISLGALVGMNCFGQQEVLSYNFFLHTAGVAGTYYRLIGPRFVSNSPWTLSLDDRRDVKVTFHMKPSSGVVGSIENVLKNPGDFGLSTFDFFAENFQTQSELEVKAKTQIVGPLNEYSCLIAVTSKKLFRSGLSSWDSVTKGIMNGQVRVTAGHRNAESYHSLKHILGLDPNTASISMDDAIAVSGPSSLESIDRVAARDVDVALFIVSEDTASRALSVEAAFQRDLAFIPVVSSAMINDKFEGESVYNVMTLTLQKNVIMPNIEYKTSCTQVVAFTGKSELIEDPVLRSIHQKLVIGIRSHYKQLSGFPR